jgi:hypothetical protein
VAEHTKQEREKSVAVLRANAVAERTTTHKDPSPAIDPSELGTEPSSRLLLKSLRVQHRTRTQRRDWAATHNTGRRVCSPAEHNHRGGCTALSAAALALQRADPLADRTTTHRCVSPVSFPRELGSEPASRLLLSCLDTQDRRQTCEERPCPRRSGGAHVSRDWASTPRTGGEVRGADEQPLQQLALRGDGNFVGRRTHGWDHHAQGFDQPQRSERARQRARQVVAVHLPAHARSEAHV